MMTLETLVERFGEVRTWKKDGVEAPHKPLLLLMALAKLQVGVRELSFVAVNEPLKKLIGKFGPQRTEYHSEFPFWRLKNDKGIWELHGNEGFEHLLNRDQLTEDELLQYNVRGGFTHDVFEALKRNPDWVIEVARAILSAHFRGNLHKDIVRAVGLSLNPDRTR
jgi:putative restriction endonuclease